MPSAYSNRGVTMIPYTAFAAAVLGLLFIFLAGVISRLRLQNKISLGDGGNNVLSRAIRAHGNLAEFAPMFLLLVLALELRGAGGVWLGVLVGGFVIARFAHAFALLARASSKARQLGAAGSYVLVASAAVWLLLSLL